MTTVTITGKLRRAIWNLPLTSARVQVALKAIFGETPIAYPAETGEPFKVDSSGNINGSGGFDVQVPTVASGNTAQYGFTFLLLDADGETESTTEQTALLNDADTTLSLEDALSSGNAGTGGEIAVSGQVYHPFGDGVPYTTGTVTVALVTGFITEDGIFPAISADIPIKNGYFNGDIDLVLYVPTGVPSEWLFTFPDGTAITAFLDDSMGEVAIADIANGDYLEWVEPTPPHERWDGDSLVYFTLDETSSSRVALVGGKTLTDNNTVGSTTGIEGNAALFAAASNESLSHAPDPAFSVGDGDFTIRLWVNIDASQVNADYGIMTMDNHPTAGREWHILGIAPDAVRFNMQNSGGADIVSVTNTIGTNALHHVVVTREGADIKVYVDAGTPTTGTISGTPNTGAATFRLGTLGTGTSYYMNGAIDEGVILKGLAWDAAQVAYDFNAGIGRRYPD